MLRFHENKKHNTAIWAGVLGLSIFLTLLTFKWKDLSIKSKASEVQSQIIIPQRIPLESPELLNSNRGVFSWRTQEIIPVMGYTNGVKNPTSADVYDRYTWNRLESNNGVYNWKSLKDNVALAKQRGGKFSFGIYTYCTEWCDNISVPSDIASNTNIYGGTSIGGRFKPDYNNKAFLDRVERMLMELGTEMGLHPQIRKGDPDFGNGINFIEMRIYGNWGEWHSGGPISDANKRRIIDMHAKAFPGKQLVAMANGAYALAYAMDLNKTTNPPVAKPIGWRNDCLGIHNSGGKIFEHFRTGMVFEPAPSSTAPSGESDLNEAYWKRLAWSKMKDRWRTAPAIGEFCGTPANGDVTSTGLDIVEATRNQIKDFHLAMFGNGNVGKVSATSTSDADRWNGFSTDQKNRWLQVVKLPGYRFELTKITVPQSIAPGGMFNVISEWRNVGVAPEYDHWNTSLALYKNGTLVRKFNTPLSVDFTKLLPNDSGSSTSTQTFNDVIIFPSLPEGTYDIHVIVEDKTLTTSGSSYRRPMALAIQGKQSDGSYKLGSITISNNSGSGIIVNPTGSPIPSNTPTLQPTNIIATPTVNQFSPTPTLIQNTSQIINTITPINSELDTPLSGLNSIVNNGSITLTAGKKYNFLVLLNNSSISGIRTDMTGTSSYTAVETASPYALFGNNGGDYFDWIPSVGTYTFKVTPIINGVDQTPFTFKVIATQPINPTFTPSPTPTPIKLPSSTPTTVSNNLIVKSITLLNADTDKSVSGYNPMINNAIIYLKANKNINFVANTTEYVQSVQFKLSGTINYTATENIAPFALFKDNQRGDFFSWTPKVGTYTLEVTPYEKKYLLGEKGSSYKITFQVK